MDAKETENRVSITELAQGAVKERINYEVPKILDNIQDLNTRADKKRTLTITIDFIPSVDRRQTVLNFTVKSKLESTSPIQTAIVIGPDANGEIIAVELVPELPGQRNLFGGEQEQPKVLKMVR
jgi:hypothetical protein